MNLNFIPPCEIRLKVLSCVGILLLCNLVIAFENVVAQEAAVWKVEEDWQLKTFQPDPSIFSPQVTFFSTPDAAENDSYFQLQMNYEADESFSAGGFHVAAVREGEIVDEERSAQQITLSNPEDEIEWTNVMAVVEGKLLFAVKDGHGQEWGQFGGPEYLVRIEQSSVVNLQNYRFEQSLENVDVGFGKNRVASICLKQVRLFRLDETVETIEVNRSP